MADIENQPELNITCKICNRQMKGLNLHLRYKHDMTPADYVKLFPGSPLYSKATRAVMQSKAGSFSRGKTFDELYGKEKSEFLRKQIAENTKRNNTGVPRTDEYKQKMRDVWNEKREEWQEALRDAWTDERRKAASDKQTLALSKRANPFRRKSKFELMAENILKGANIPFETQFRSRDRILSQYRFFDIYIPSMNLLVELDGEYWHTKPDRIQIDEAKIAWARDNSFKILRLSDREFSRGFENTDANADIFMSALKLNDDEIIAKTNTIMENRKQPLTSG
jgi:very-short-patch-repair endonuclease